jgi:hypothetical protein
MYEYRMLQVPPTIVVKQKELAGNEAAYYLQTLANEQAAQGWEFFRVDTVGVVVQPGCLASLFGAQRTVTEYYVVTFRRPK